MIVLDWKWRASVIFCGKDVMCLRVKIYVVLIDFTITAWIAQALPIVGANEWRSAAPIY